MAFNCRIIKHALSSTQSGERPWTVCRKLVFSNQLMGVPGCSRTLGYRGATGIASTDRQLPSLARPTPTLSFPSIAFPRTKVISANGIWSNLTSIL